MDFLTIFLIALGLSFDTFAVSLSFGVVQNKILFWQASRVAIVLAIFQAGMTVMGYFLGSLVSDFIMSADHWVALVLLCFLGIRMIVEGITRKENGKPRDYTRTRELITVAIGTSIDAFAVGISFGLLKMQIWLSGVIIGAVTFIASMTAIKIGKSAGTRLGQRVEVVGGVILIAIGVKIFLEHMLG